MVAAMAVATDMVEVRAVTDRWFVVSLAACLSADFESEKTESLAQIVRGSFRGRVQGLGASGRLFSRITQVSIRRGTRGE